jgi:hypothetical protein
LQSTLHEEWGRHYGSTLETRYTYTPSDCFETFPFPVFLAGVDDIGKHYYQHRQSIMQTRQEGLTKAYNRFHNPAEISPDIAEFRRLHIEMDQAVAAAYGWQNIDLGHDFHDTKQGIRFTISEAARREILDRLLALNHQRHAEEVAAGLHDKKPTKATGRRKRAEPSAPAPMDDLFANLAPTHPNPSASGVDGASPILAFLQTHPGWHGKEAILAATGFPADRWTATIQTHLAAGAVERQGERRGARYRLKEMHESG